jgi:hypothetical protein
MSFMWCLSNEESQDWCRRIGLQLDEENRPILRTRAHCVEKSLAELKVLRLTSMSRWIAEYLQPFDECLLWVTLWDVWNSSENFHLYYRLRESYGDRRRLSAGPGHLFGGHESSDLATFIELALLFGWDFYLLTSPEYQTAFVSHDEFMQLFTNNSNTAEEAKALKT